VGDRIGLEALAKRRTCFIPGIEPRILGRPVHSMATDSNYRSCARNRYSMTVNSVGNVILISIKGGNKIRFLEWLLLNHDEVHWTGL
jgi:hypothetical protein